MNTIKIENEIEKKIEVHAKENNIPLSEELKSDIQKVEKLLDNIIKNLRHEDLSPEAIQDETDIKNLINKYEHSNELEVVAVPFLKLDPEEASMVKAVTDPFEKSSYLKENPLNMEIIKSPLHEYIGRLKLEEINFDRKNLWNYHDEIRDDLSVSDEKKEEVYKNTMEKSKELNNQKSFLENALDQYDERVDKSIKNIVVQEPENLGTKFKKEEIDFSQLQKLGNIDNLLNNDKQLNEILNGRISPLMYFSHETEKNKHHFQAKFQVVLNDKGNPQINIIGVQRELQIPNKIGETIITPADKELLKTTNNLFKTAKVNGEKFFVSIDKEVNAVVFQKTDTLMKNQDLTKYAFTEKEVEQIKDGMIVKGYYFDAQKENISVASDSIKAAVSSRNEITSKIQIDTYDRETGQKIDSVKKENTLSQEIKNDHPDTPKRKRGRGL